MLTRARAEAGLRQVRPLGHQGAAAVQLDHEGAAQPVGRQPYRLRLRKVPRRRGGPAAAALPPLARTLKSDPSAPGPRVLFRGRLWPPSFAGAPPHGGAHRAQHTHTHTHTQHSTHTFTFAFSRAGKYPVEMMEVPRRVEKVAGPGLLTACQPDTTPSDPPCRRTCVPSLRGSRCLRPRSPSCKRGKPPSARRPSQSTRSSQGSTTTPLARRHHESCPLSLVCRVCGVCSRHAALPPDVSDDTVCIYMV